MILILTGLVFRPVSSRLAHTSDNEMTPVSADTASAPATIPIIRGRINISFRYYTPSSSNLHSNQSTMTIIHRSNLSSDYADLLCTTSTKQTHTPLISSPLRKSWLAEQTQVLKRESSAWSEAIFPPISEMKIVLERLYSDPDMSMTNIFKVCAPVWIFGCVLILGSWLSEQRSRRLLEQRAAIAVGDIPLPDIEWGQITKPFLWCVFGGLLFIYIAFTVVGNAIGRFVGPEATANKGENARWQPSGSRFSSGWEPDAVDIYSAMFKTV